MKPAILTAAALIVAQIASADSTADDRPDGWTGEGALSGGITRGNTNSSEAGLRFDVDRIAGKWSTGLEGSVDYGQQEGVDSKNRAFVGMDLDRDFNDRAFTFTRGSYEVDQFTGFDSRAFIGGGIGYRVFESETLKFVVRGGPGAKIDNVKRQITTDENGAALIIPATQEVNVGAVAKSEFDWAINDKVTFSNNADVIYSADSTQLTTGFALTAALAGPLAARVSVDTRYDTSALDGFKSTDTASRIALVYTLGK